MKVDILGCSGGMGQQQQTTCFRINDSLLIDAGSGLGELDQGALKQIRHICLTHAHLDHICFLPLLIDNLFESLTQPIQVYALPEVIENLRKHLFNWQIWPDFTRLPTPEKPVMTLHEIGYQQTLELGDLSLTPFRVFHTVPTCGYHLRSKKHGTSFAITSDTTFDASLLDSLNQLGPLDVLLTECAFPDRMLELARLSRHLTPQLLQALLNQLTHAPKAVWISHLKPSQHLEIANELAQANLNCELRVLRSGEQWQI